MTPHDGSIDLQASGSRSFASQRSRDALEEATEILEEPSKNIKRKILISINLIVGLVVLLHVIIQLATVGHLPAPARDNVVLPLIVLVNMGSAAYNLWVLRGEHRERRQLDLLSRGVTIGLIQLACLVFVHLNPNTATSVLFDQSLSILTVFLTGVIVGPRAAIAWFAVTVASFAFAVQTRGIEFEYVLMTRGEVAALNGLDAASAGARQAAAAAEGLTPLPLALFAVISLVYTGLTLAATYFEAGLIGRVTAAMPAAVKKIQIAAREKQRLAQENLRMGLELDVAQRLQAMILPRGAELGRHKGLEIAAHMVPASEIGGDIYDVLEGPNGSTCLVIGDVTDHGLASGVVMLMAQAALRTALEATDCDLVRALNRVNSVIYKNVSERMGDARNLTLALLHYDEGAVELAGQHETVIIVRKDGHVDEIDTLPLGINVGLLPEVEDMMLASHFTLAPGDLLVLYTDGVTEAEAPNKAQFGGGRLREAVVARRSQSCDEIVKGVFADIYGWIGGGTVYDDITLVVVRRTA
jgi:serine phosphatase RsbU (regulator of sigma subunit)